VSSGIAVASVSPSISDAFSEVSAASLEDSIYSEDSLLLSVELVSLFVEYKE